MNTDVLVLGAGIVGVSVAVHLQKRGCSTVLVDRRAAAAETLYGNAGLVQREGVYPYGFPHDFGALARYSLNRTIDAHYYPSAIPRITPFLWQYWKHSRPARHRAIAHLYARLIEHCIVEHDALAAEAGAQDLFRRTGWMKIFRTERERDLAPRGGAMEDRLRHQLGFPRPQGDPGEGAARRAGARRRAALHRPDRRDRSAGLACVSRALPEAGWSLHAGNGAGTLEPGWTVRTVEDLASARDVVIALGPWADGDARLGYDLPLAVKRGYHMHYRAAGSAVFNHPMLDQERGYFLAPMRAGIRLTTGAEFALRDGMKTLSCS